MKYSRNLSPCTNIISCEDSSQGEAVLTRLFFLGRFEYKNLETKLAKKKT